MFELPAITVLGKAKDVILGIASVGTDLDGTMMYGDFEFLDDSHGEDDNRE